MKTVLRIDHTFFELGTGANINALVAILQKAKPLHRKFHHTESRDKYVLGVEKPEIEILFVQDSQIEEKPKHKAIPEKASPDANNTF